MKKSSAWKMVCIVLMFCTAAVINSPAQTFTTLYQFCRQQNCADGEMPFAGLLQASDGNLYGTTWGGGTYGTGTVFQITPGGTLSTVYMFGSQPNDPFFPTAALVQATDGNFYGTTGGGGASGNCTFGCGTVFKITPSGTLTTLHSFNVTDGEGPWAGLVQSTDGNFYGTTPSGGSGGNCEMGGCGTVFKITPGGTLTTLHNFVGSDGAKSYATLVQATDGNLYGTTIYGGASNNCDQGCGTVFKITPKRHAQHTVQLHRR